MPMPPRPVDATLHGVVDYTAGAFLMTAFPKVAGIEGTRAARQIRRAGAIHAGYSTLTDYPLGVVKVLPFQAHLALDAVGAVALAATPFVTGQFLKGRRHWVPARGPVPLRARLARAHRSDRHAGTSTGTSSRCARPTWRTPTARSTTAGVRWPGPDSAETLAERSPGLISEGDG